MRRAIAETGKPSAQKLYPDPLNDVSVSARAHPDDVRLAFVILASRPSAPVTVPRLVHALYDPAHLFLIHVDLKANQTIHDELSELSAADRNVHVLRTRRLVQWGGFSMVAALLDAVASFVERVDFDFVIMNKTGSAEGIDISVAPADGVYIYGLFLEGARWDAEAHCLAESQPKELFVTFPAIHLDPKVDRKLPTKGVYSCPCYKTTTRAGTLSTTGHSTNFVLMVEVPSKEPCSGNFSKYCETYSAHWIKRAVALFTTLNY